MDKIQLTFRRSKEENLDFDVVYSSTRRYRHILVDLPSISQEAFYMIKKRASSIKSLEFENCKLSCFDLYSALTFAKNSESLRFHHCKYNDNMEDNYKTDVEMPYMKNLVMDDSSYKIVLNLKVSL